MQKTAAAIAALILLWAAVWWSAASVGNQPAPDETQIAQGEQIIHHRPGSDKPGEPAVASALTAGRLDLTVVDAATGDPVPCRVNVIGPDGNYYEPDDNPLALWSLKRSGNREGKGPFRYYGWFFYSDGTSRVEVPPGKITVEVWKGFEYTPVVREVTVGQGAATALTVKLERGIDMTRTGWYSGDPHIHLRRNGEYDDARALELMAAEDIRFSQILCFNLNRNYVPQMGQQLTPQFNGMGDASIRTRGIYTIGSGQEYRGSVFGHILHLGASRIVDADGLKTNTDNWPPFGLVADEVHGLGGISIHAHGGYEKEIYADFAQQATDGVELLQFAVYRGIGLEGWYHILSAGYRFPAIGASDYPYCRALGDCRTYVKLDTAQPTMADYNRALAEGRSFFTTGPLVEFKVDGKQAGEELELAKGATVKVQAKVTSLVADVQELQIIEGGTVRFRKTVNKDEQRKPIRWSLDLPIQRSTWIAFRAIAPGPDEREDVEAHTNPVFISVGDKPRIKSESIRWLLAKLDERIRIHESRKFAEKPKVLAYFAESRKRLLERLEQAE